MHWTRRSACGCVFSLAGLWNVAHTCRWWFEPYSNEMTNPLKELKGHGRQWMTISIPSLCMSTQPTVFLK